MIILIGGATHTGKTKLAQKILEKYHFPYLSIDHLKMGLIRSKNTDLSPLSSDEQLTSYLWPIIVEMIKTAIENNQNLVIEGCYIPFNWKESFDEKYLNEIKYYCLIMSKKYIENNYEIIKKYQNVIEKRIDDCCPMKDLIIDNENSLIQVKKYNLNYILIDDNYNFDIEI